MIRGAGVVSSRDLELGIERGWEGLEAMWKTLWLVMGGVVSIAPAALADASGNGDAGRGPKPGVEQLLDIMRSDGQIDDQQYDALLARARAERAATAVSAAGPSCVAAQAAEPVSPAEPEKPAVKVSTGWSGLEVESGDGAFTFQVGGRLQTDFAVFDEDVSPMGDGAEIRRARIRVQGRRHRREKLRSRHVR
jgi:hypothetical protein